MNSTSDTNMEEISLENEDRHTMEYKILMAYAQRRLSASKYGQLLEREVKTLKGSSTERGEREGIPQVGKGETHQELSIQGKRRTLQYRKQKRKLMKRRMREEGPQELATNQDTVNGYGLQMRMARQRSVTSSSEAAGEAVGFLHVADKLAEIVNARSCPARQGGGFRALERTQSLEADGGQDEEERIIERIVALLRQSGDKLEETIKKDRTFYRYVTEMLSYAFFKKLTDQYLQVISGDSTRETEGKIQCTKAAFVMEVTTRLTAVDNHPMNMVLGFGMKYLKENFSPWIQNHGGWENAVGLLDEEEVE